MAAVFYEEGCLTAILLALLLLPDVGGRCFPGCHPRLNVQTLSGEGVALEQCLQQCEKPPMREQVTVHVSCVMRDCECLAFAECLTFADVYETAFVPVIFAVQLRACEQVRVPVPGEVSAPNISQACSSLVLGHSKSNLTQMRQLVRQTALQYKLCFDSHLNNNKQWTSTFGNIMSMWAVKYSLNRLCGYLIQLFEVCSMITTNDLPLASKAASLPWLANTCYFVDRTMHERQKIVFHGTTMVTSMPCLI